MRISVSKGTAHYTDRQIVSKLLCGECEKLFSKFGEDAVARLWATKKAFPLFDLVKSFGDRLVIGEVGEFYYPEDFPGRLVESLFYFAASVVWRSNCWPVESSEWPHRGSLGSKFELRFRRYLLGLDSTIDGALLLVTICNVPELNSYVTTPFCGKSEGVHFHKFDVLGLSFAFVVGQIPPDSISAGFRRFNTNILICSAHPKHRGDFIRAAEAIKNVEVRGKKRETPTL